MGVQTYLSAISNGRGMAKSNLYSVYFSGGPIDNNVDGKQRLTQKFGGINRANTGGTFEVGDRILLMCDEVTLPGVQSSTGTVGRYSGANPTYYPSNVIYNDVQLSFMCDAEMQALHFLHDWRDMIYSVEGTGKDKNYRINYANEYQCERMVIKKNERDKSSEIGLTAVTYNLYGAWPYAIDAIPLSYGSSQLVKVTANFYYANWDSEWPANGLPVIT